MNTFYRHCTSHLSRSQPSLVALLRAAVLPLDIGGLKNTQEENRLCELCDLGEVNPIFFCAAHIAMI